MPYNNDDLNIDKNFPMPEYRPLQKEVIKEALGHYNNGMVNVVLQAPTGYGKSIPAITMARIMGSAYYLTIQKVLQTALDDKFGQWLSVLKGRNAYPCLTMIDKMGGKNVNADNGLCMRKGKGSLPECSDICQYQLAVERAQKTNISVFNFYNFLFQRAYAKRFEGPRELIIIDEAHQLESQIMSFVEFTIRPTEFGEPVPKCESVEEYCSLLENKKVIQKLEDELENNKKELQQLPPEDDRCVKLAKDIDHLKSVLHKYSAFVSALNKGVEFVAEYSDEKSSVTFKPIYASYHAPLILSGGQHRLLMSATILNLNVYSNSLGLDKAKSVFIEIPHPFPVENRLIHLECVGSMKAANKKETMPKMVEKVRKLMEKHSNQRGIIHCQSFYLMREIIKSLPSKQAGRLTHQDKYNNKDDLLHAHSKKKDSVLIGPALHEGIDLIDDLSRFQIIIKVPYPDFTNNKQMQIRMKRDWSWYLWLTACKLIQSIGRSCRSSTDWCSTYICDSDIFGFLSNCTKCGLLPKWFVDAIRVNGEPI